MFTQSNKLVNILTYIKLRNRELNIEISGDLNVFEIIEVIRNICANATSATHQIIGSTQASCITCIRNMTISESVFLFEGIKKLNIYIYKISPDKITINFVDFCNRNFPDFVLVMNNTTRPTMAIEISSVVGNCRFNTKSIGDKAFDCIRKFYSNNISLHT